MGDGEYLKKTNCSQRDNFGGKIVILEEINGDYLNMMDLNCLICQECHIGPDCIRNLIYLFDGVRLEIENDRELMAMWADSKAVAMVSHTYFLIVWFLAREHKKKSLRVATIRE